MPTYTTNLNLSKPTVGGDGDVWGGELNGNADKLEAALSGGTALPQLRVDNIDLNGNTISTTNTDGDLNLTPNGTGAVVASRVRSASYTDASGGNTATFNGIPLRPGVLDPENRIINGAMDFWQRDTSTTGIDAYCADRWRNQGSKLGVTQGRQSFTLGTTLGLNNPTYFLRQTSGATLSLTTDYARTQQRVEGVRSYAGQTITVLGWAKVGSGSASIAVEVFQNFGTGGSPSAEVTGTGQALALTTTWTPFAATFSVPSISGKTLGSNGDDYFGVNFWSAAGSSFNTRAASIGIQNIQMDLWGVHIKVGTHTTAACDLYKAPELGTEVIRCKRYFNSGSYNEGGGAGAKYINAATTNMFNSTHNFPCVMRTSPTIATATAPTFSNCSNLVFTGVTPEGFGTRVDAAAAGVYRAFLGAWTADAEL